MEGSCEALAAKGLPDLFDLEPPPNRFWGPITTRPPLRVVMITLAHHENLHSQPLEDE